MVKTVYQVGTTTSMVSGVHVRLAQLQGKMGWNLIRLLHQLFQGLWNSSCKVFMLALKVQ
jgi:hypothetical protein